MSSKKKKGKPHTHPPIYIVTGTGIESGVFRTLKDAQKYIDLEIDACCADPDEIEVFKGYRLKTEKVSRLEVFPDELYEEVEK